MPVKCVIGAQWGEKPTCVGDWYWFARYKEIGANGFFYVASADSLVQSLIGPPAFLYDRLEAQERARGQPARESSATMARSGLNAESRPSETPVPPAPPAFLVTERRSDSGVVEVVPGASTIPPLPPLPPAAPNTAFLSAFLNAAGGPSPVGAFVDSSALGLQDIGDGIVLLSSFNVPAVELVSRLGAASALHTLRLAGFASLDRGADHYGLGLALGNGDVTLLEQANAYRALANGGVWRPVRWLAEDRPAGDSSAVERRVMTAGASALVLDILADPVARLPGFGAGSALEFPFPVAAKTGTSRHFTDNWAVAVTELFTVAAWVGNFSGRAMRGVSGVTGAAPLVHRLVLATARRYPPGTLPDPQSVGARRLAICRLSGGEPGPECPGETEWFLPGTAPSGRCDWHRDGRVELPLEYGEWALGAETVVGSSVEQLATTALHGSQMAAASPDRRAPFRIVSPRDGDRYSVPPGTDPRYATLALRAAGQHPGEAVRWFIDGTRLRGERWTLAVGSHVIAAVTASGKRDEVRIDVK